MFLRDYPLYIYIYQAEYYARVLCTSSYNSKISTTSTTNTSTTVRVLIIINIIIIVIIVILILPVLQHLYLYQSQQHHNYYNYCYYYWHEYELKLILVQPALVLPAKSLKPQTPNQHGWRFTLPCNKDFINALTLELTLEPLIYSLIFLSSYKIEN